MAGNDLIFALNELFNEADRRQLVSHLLKHPIIWNYLENKKNFELIKNNLGDRVGQWTPLNILLSANDHFISMIGNHSLENLQIPEQFSDQDFNQEPQLDDFVSYHAIVEWFKKKYQLEKNWIFLYEFLNFKGETADLIVEKFGTLLSILLEVDPVYVDLLSDLFNYVPIEIASFISAKLIFLYAKNDQSLHNMFDLLKTKVNPEERLEILKQLKRLGQDDLVIELSSEELKEEPIKENYPIENNYPISFDEELNQISILKNQIELSNLATQKEKAEYLLNRAETRAARILSALDKLRIDHYRKNDPNGSNILGDFKILKNETQQGELPTEFQQLSLLENQVKLFNSIYLSDQNSARQLAISIIQSINNLKDKKLLIYWIDRKGMDEIIVVIEKFLTLDIIYETRDLAMAILECHPQNIQIIKFLANINYRFGDKYAAVYFYGLADSLIELKNDEKDKFADALTDNGYWEQAAKIFADLSITNKKYFKNQLFCLYQSGQYEEGLSLYDKNIKENYQDVFVEVLAGLLLGKMGKHADAEDKINKALLEGNPDDAACFLAAEYFSENTDLISARDLLRKGINESKEISKSLIKLIEILSKLKNEDGAEGIIKDKLSSLSISDESVFRNVIKINNSVFNPQLIEKIIYENKKKWPLMPEVIACQAHEYLESKNFDKSKKLLKPLLKRERKEKNWIADYCFSIIRCTNQDFPLEIHQEHIAKLSDSESREINDLIKEYRKILPFKLIDFILFSSKPLDELLKIESDFENISLDDFWQINAFIGKQYYESGQYDQSIYFLEKAATNNNTHLLIQQYLITAYEKLNLWHETQLHIMHIFPKIRNDLILLKRVFDGIGDQTTKIDLLNKLEIIDPGNPFIKAMQSYVQIKNGNLLIAQEELHRIVNNQYLSTDLLLFIAQLLIEIGEKKLPIWIINKVLSKNGINDAEHIASAFLLFQLSEQEKAIQSISQISSKDYINQILKIWMQIQSEIKCNYGELIKEINEIENQGRDVNYEKTLFSLINLPSDIIKDLRNPVNLVVDLIRILLQKNSLNEAIQVAEKGLDIFPYDENLIALWLEMCLISDGAQIIDYEARVAAIFKENRNIGNFNLQCISSEIDLKNNYDIQVAQRITEMSKIEKEQPRVRLIQARLLAKAGKKEQALRFFDGFFEELKNNQSVPRNINDMLISINPLYTVGFLEAAFDLKEYTRIIDICLSLFDNEIITNHILDIFLRSLASILEVNGLLSIVGIRNQLVSIDEPRIRKTIEKLSLLEENQNNKKNHLIFQYCFFLLNETKPKYREFIENQLNNLESKSLIYAAHLLEKQYSIEEYLDSGDPDLYFYTAVLNYERYQYEALNCLTELIKSDSKKAEYYALLALIKQKEGFFEEAYSAINLALNIKNDEPLLLMRAGELAELIGDDISAIRYYEQSINLDPEKRIEDKLIQLYVKTKNTASLKFIEERVSKHIQDENILIFLANSFLAKKDFRKATYYSDLLLKNNKNVPDTMIIKSRIAYAYKNYQKANEILSKIAFPYQNNIEYILQKAKILEVTDNIQTAIDYLDEVKPHPVIGEESIVILKSALIENQDGINAALDYLDSMSNINKSTAILLAISKIFLQQGQYIKAEQLLENEIEKSPRDPEILVQMALIARDKGDLDKAVDLLINSIQNNPYAGKYYKELANIYLLRREFKKGIEILREGQKNNPYDEDIPQAINAITNQEKYFVQANSIDLESISLENILEL